MLVSLLAMVACRDPVSSAPVVSTPPALMAVSAPEVINYRFSVGPITTVAQCTGEPIVVSGEVHTLVKIWNTPESFRIQGHNNSNLSGIGLSTGRKYLLLQTNNAIQEFEQNGPNGIAQQVFHFHVITQGKEANFSYTMNGTFIFSAGGVEFIPRKVEAVCQ
jgi:hypothetical protein